MSKTPKPKETETPAAEPEGQNATAIAEMTDEQRAFLPTVQRRIDHNNKTWEPGEKFDPEFISEAQAHHLIDIGVITPPADPEAPGTE